MKNSKLKQSLEILKNLKDVKKKTFAYAVFKNIEKIEKEIEIFEKLQKQPHPDYINYDNERNLLCMIHSKKDEYDNPVLIQEANGMTSYDIIDREKFNQEYIQLADKYRYVLEDMDASKKEFDDFMNADSTLTFEKISINDLPDDIDANYLEKISFMLP